MLVYRMSETLRSEGGRETMGEREKNGRKHSTGPPCVMRVFNRAK